MRDPYLVWYFRTNRYESVTHDPMTIAYKKNPPCKIVTLNRENIVNLWIITRFSKRFEKAMTTTISTRLVLLLESTHYTLG